MLGQTVAASMQAPTLFVIAADLTKMRVLADVDESDVGRIRPGQLISGDVEPGTALVSAVTLPSQASGNTAGRSPLVTPSRGGAGGGRPTGG